MDELEPLKGAWGQYGALGMCLSAALGLIWYLVRLVKYSFIRLSNLADRMMEWLNNHLIKMDENTREQKRLSDRIEDVLRQKDKNGD